MVLHRKEWNLFVSVQAIATIAAEERAKLFVPVSIAQYSVYEALAADLLDR